VLGVDPKTLRKLYREELDLGETKANAQWRASCSARRRTATSRRRSSGSRHAPGGARPQWNCGTQAPSAERIRLSEPPTPGERLQLIAAHLERRPIVILPHKCETIDEWLDRYGVKPG
jgi:hypothetical protein